MTYAVVHLHSPIGRDPEWKLMIAGSKEEAEQVLRMFESQDTEAYSFPAHQLASLAREIQRVCPKP